MALLSSWTVTGLVLLAGAAGFYSSRRPRPDGGEGGRLRRDYLRGLNFLVNDQPDRALESFMRVAEVDEDTVEMHLALGALFRRRGEIDRAIRIHQNIIAREHIDASLREQAIGREMIGMRVRVDEVADAQAVACRQREVAVDLAHLGVDQRRGAARFAADEIGLATAGGDLFEDHVVPPAAS